MRAATAICPVLIQNHCHVEGWFTTFGGTWATDSEVCRLMRESSRCSTMTCRARLSQVAVACMESPGRRFTLTVACPLRMLNSVPTGIVLNVPAGNVVEAMLGGTGCCISAYPLTA